MWLSEVWLNKFYDLVGDVTEYVWLRWLTSQVLQISQIPGNTTLSEINGISDTKRATFSCEEKKGINWKFSLDHTYDIKRHKGVIMVS